MDIQIPLNRCGTLSLTDQNMGKCSFGNILEDWAREGSVLTLVRQELTQKLMVVGGELKLYEMHDLRDSQTRAAYDGWQKWKSISLFPLTKEGLVQLRNHLGKNSIRLAGLD